MELIIQDTITKIYSKCFHIFVTFVTKAVARAGT